MVNSKIKSQMRPVTCAPGQNWAATLGAGFVLPGSRAELQTTRPRRPCNSTSLHAPPPPKGVRQSRRAGPRGCESRDAVWGVKSPRRSRAHKAQAQRVGWQQHQVAAVLASASRNRCRQVGASRGGWRGSLHLALLSYLYQGLKRVGRGRRSRDKAAPSSPGVAALATQQVGEGQRYLLPRKLPSGTKENLDSNPSSLHTCTRHLLWLRVSTCKIGVKDPTHLTVTVGTR